VKERHLLGLQPGRIQADDLGLPGFGAPLSHDARRHFEYGRSPRPHGLQDPLGERYRDRFTRPRARSVPERARRGGARGGPQDDRVAVRGSQLGAEGRVKAAAREGEHRRARDGGGHPADGHAPHFRRNLPRHPSPRAPTTRRARGR